MPVREAPARLLAGCQPSFAPHALRLAGNILMGAMFYSLIYMLIGEESSLCCCVLAGLAGGAAAALPLPALRGPACCCWRSCGAWSGLASSADGTPGHICPGV